MVLEGVTESICLLKGPSMLTSTGMLAFHFTPNLLSGPSLCKDKHNDKNKITLKLELIFKAIIKARLDRIDN